MIIQKSRVYTADIHEIYNKRKIVTMLTSLNGQVTTIYLDSSRIEKDAIVVRFGNRYVPIKYLKNAVDYFSVKASIGMDKRILGDSARNCRKVGTRFVKKVKPLFNEQGQISLKELADLKNELNNDEELN